MDDMDGPGGCLDECEGAYLDALYNLPKPQRLPEVRRAYALWIALGTTAGWQEMTKLAHDLEGYLKDGLRGTSELQVIHGGKLNG